jgi:hypothetical protein
MLVDYSNDDHLPKTLSWRDSLLFPLATEAGRSEVIIGGLLMLLLLPIGWILNLGARLDVVHRLYTAETPYFWAFRPWLRTFRRGCIAACAIFFYLLPSIVLLSFAVYSFSQVGFSVGTVLLGLSGLAAFVLAIFTLPGCMAVFACEGDPRVLRNPLRAFKRSVQHGRIYLKAWAIAIVSILLSFLGLLALGVGFFFTSVWAWGVVGYAFTVALYSRSETQ